MMCDVFFKVRGLSTEDPEKLKAICAQVQKIIDSSLALAPEEAVGWYDCTTFNIDEVKE